MENAIYKILEKYNATLNKIDSEVIVDVDELKYQPIIYEFIKLGLNVGGIQLTQKVGAITFGLKQVFEVNGLDIEKLCQYKICVEKGCDKVAVVDYNGEGHWNCESCYERNERYFEDEYK